MQRAGRAEERKGGQLPWWCGTLTPDPRCAEETWGREAQGLAPSAPLQRRCTRAVRPGTCQGAALPRCRSEVDVGHTSGRLSCSDAWSAIGALRPALPQSRCRPGPRRALCPAASQGALPVTMCTAGFAAEPRLYNGRGTPGCDVPPKRETKPARRVGGLPQRPWRNTVQPDRSSVRQRGWQTKIESLWPTAAGHRAGQVLLILPLSSSSLIRPPRASATCPAGVKRRSRCVACLQPAALRRRRAGTAREPDAGSAGFPGS
mmetsp:Transcript_14517/g.42388  ORF Transcript_14517/g.42388 Transcript_14517/m.42388 type:complete len:261 (+) Transcript_14517:321-1103(+)|eukprot:364555-Chlamydomonas_euryale.AAC.4